MVVVAMTIGNLRLALLAGQPAQDKSQQSPSCLRIGCACLAAVALACFLVEVLAHGVFFL